MKIGVLVAFNDMESFEDRLKALKNENFDNCQVQSWNPSIWTDENATQVKALLEKYGITVSAFWCGWTGPQVWDFYDGQLTLGLVPPEYRAMRVQQLCDGADFAHKIGVQDVITHMGFIPENPNDPNFAPFCVAVRAVAQHLKKNDQWLLFETGQETPVTMLRCFEKVNMDNLGINLDTANLILYGRGNPVDAMDVFGKYVRNLHAKDGNFPVNGHELGVETRLGEGKADIRGVIQKLHDVNFDRYITIEREIEEGSSEQMQDIRDARAYLQGFIDEIYG